MTKQNDTPSSKSRTWSRSTAAIPARWTASPSASPPASCSDSWAPTARARRRPSASWPPCCEPTEGTARVAGFDVTKQPAEVRKRLGLAQQTPALDAFSTGRETLELAGILQRMPRARGQEAGRRAPGAHGPERGRQQADRPVLRRHEAAPGPGQRAHAPAAGPHPGRADRGAGPAEPNRAVGGARAHQPRGHDHAADHPLHGRGGPALRPAGDHRQRQDRDRRLAARAEGIHRRRHRRPPAGVDQREPREPAGIGPTAAGGHGRQPMGSAPTPKAWSYRSPMPARPSRPCSGSWTAKGSRLPGSR